MRFTPWATRMAMILGLSATALLTACGGGGGSSNTQVRLLNATQSYAALDLSVNDKTINSKIAYANVGSYGDVDTANTATKILTSDVGTSVSATTPTLASGTNYTYIAYGFAGAVSTTLLQEGETAPDSGKAKLLVLNLAPDAGTLDVYITTANDSLDTATAFYTGLVARAGSGYTQINSGTYRVRITGTTKRGTDLRLDQTISLDSASVNTLVLTATSSGTLVNGIKLVQKGAVTNLPNSLSRVRVVHALAGTTTATVGVQNTTLMPTSLAPNFSNYSSFPAGASNLTAAVNGTALSVSSVLPTLEAGKDYTLLLWGTAAAPNVTPLVDDNRLPSVTGNVKIRLINAMSVASALATLNVDYTSLASNVIPGTSSLPTSISSSTGSVVTVNSPVQLAPLYNPGSTNSSGLTPLTANGVYTVFIMGDPSSPSGLLQKDR
ncbi:MAG: hypothetical protein DI603_07775 [Roseateles depolymerans]|uniref:DUF4397 domain-containing protein n=1 Tax=Roseateles depolymerans TaxID=76731 RepID=A0A2W5FUM9_9BURK|nr:MAG: hypothetical protein DI603_07775 [Roseateles depolymerans]